MPWHEVQYLKITCRTGPCGGTTCGRVAREPAAHQPASGHQRRDDDKQRTLSVIHRP